ncbi:hypothetical protein K2173_024530 [Erythroxylum novogranatense]|uniref:Protein LNK3 n=1 Tax=Erythroxylum novogranatense TaxID=1862640 RepID=A0AAV8SVN0_9ROSI|nr:hypothetical protein K2173_024530 [Erythroxylum novogranatense]
MDWYLGSGNDYCVVPKDLRVSDRLPSPQSWSKWGISGFESYGLPHSCSFEDTNLNQENIALNDGQLKTESCKQRKDDSTVSGLARGRFEEPAKQSTLGRDQPDHHHHPDGAAGLEQFEEFFLSSLLEDLPGIETLDKPYCFSPGSQFEMGSPDNLVTDMILDSLSVCDSTHSMGSSRYLKTHAFSPSMSWEDDKVQSTEFPQCNSEQEDHLSAKVPPVNVLVPPEHNSINGDMEGQFSLEESVLQQLTMVMAQLTDKTRLCFRDALYRMAKSSTQRLQYQTGDLPEENFPWTVDHDETISDDQITELETNAIDRAVAGLMFNKQDLEAPDFSVSASSVDSKQEFMRTTGTGDYSSNHSSIAGPNYAVFPGDAEVPVFMSTVVNAEDQSSGNLAQNMMQQFYSNA